MAEKLADAHKDADASAARAELALEAEVDTDAIVRAAKAMRDVNETRAARDRTCLIVDDSRVIRKVAAKIALSLGYRVIEAEDGAEALARCEQAMPDLVLTDWQMPVMSGPEFVSELRKLPVSQAPTVVFCTSKGEAADIHVGIGAGADDYIVKPFDEAALSAKLERLGVERG
ncbi:response regulator [Altererythrobacter sp.]|uniref:response regulator n=1 Tax=Altererythrobacter sp. TaxID=1872480 RepID=UPI00338F784A